MNSRPTRLFLIRHAETEWNALEIFQGQLDSELTPRGIQQAAELAARLASEGIEVIYSSDQGRCMRTAEIVGSRLGLSVVPRADLREIDCGEWTCKSYREVYESFPDKFDNWRYHPHVHAMPGGESILQVQRRGILFLEHLRQRHPGQTVCAITHATILRGMLCHVRGWPLSKLWEGERQLNCAINVIAISSEGVTLLEIGKTDHLSSVGRKGSAPVT